MFSINKNSYLHNYYADINPRLINRCVQKAWDSLGILDVYDLEPPLNRLTSEQPCIPIPNVDLTRRPLAFGRLAMPKLRRELHDKDSEVVIAAIKSIGDLVHDPERGYEAIKYRVVDRMMNLVVDENPIIRERTNRVLALLARLTDGREAIVSNNNLLANIACTVEDELQEVRLQTACLLEMLSRCWKTADKLMEFGFVDILLHNLLNENKEIVPIHLQTLQHMMYGMQGRGEVLDSNGFSVLMTLLEDGDNLDHPSIISETLGCLALLTSTCEGEKMSRGVQLLRIANKFLHYEDPEIYTNAANVIMFCTVITTQKLEAATIPTMTKRLVALSKNYYNRSVQMYAIKALTNIAEHPDIRKELRKKYCKDVENIPVVGDQEIARFKNTLQGVINWSQESAT